jgi:hypothetical protein
MMNRSRPTLAFSLHPRNLTLAALTPLLLALAALAGAAPGDDNRAPYLGDCQDLKIPAGNKVAFHAFGVGVQIYTWTGTSWSFVSPEALLFADHGDHDLVGFHFAGPTWEGLDGSSVVGAVDQGCTPNPDAIPWLRLKAASNEGRGIFQRVTYIQRLYTVGGEAPTVPGTFPGQVARVPYSAEYFFYRAAR